MEGEIIMAAGTGWKSPSNITILGCAERRIDTSAGPTRDVAVVIICDGCRKLDRCANTNRSEVQREWADLLPTSDKQ